MPVRPSIARSIPFWILVIGSLVSFGLGLWMVLSKIGTMLTAITAQSATAATDVYGGQSWIVFGAALVTAGLIGLALALAVAAVGSLLRSPEPVEAAGEVEIVAVDEADFARDFAPAPSDASVPATPAAAEAAPTGPEAAEAAPTGPEATEADPAETQNTGAADEPTPNVTR